MTTCLEQCVEHMRLACGGHMQNRTEQNRTLTNSLWLPFREILTLGNARETVTK